MKKHSLLTTLGVLGISYLCSANEPDSVYLYSYGNPANQGRSGLQYAWSLDQKDWNSIGNERTFLSCDYGRWGSEKRMHSPYMINVDNLWHIVWSLNDYDNAFAYTTSEDLLKWKPQKYIQVASENCTNPVISYNPNTKIFTVAYQSKEKYFETSTKDFKQFSKAKEITEDNYSNLSTSEIVNEKLVSGQIQRVAWNDINNLIRDCQVRAYNDAKYNERMAQDGERFAGLQPLTATIKANPDNTKDISSMLIGAFFEDINYAADGGL